MNSLTSANILICILMVMQVVVALILHLFHAQISNLLPAVFSTQVLLFVSAFFAIFLPSILFLQYRSKKTGKSIKKLLRLNPLSGRNIMLVVAMSITIQPFMSLLSIIAAFFYPNNIAGVIGDLTESVSYPVMVLILALMPAFFEELALRGAILSAYRKKLDFKRVAAINGLFFAMMHLNGQQLLYTFAIGAFLAYLVEKTDSLFASIISHFTINFWQTTMAAIVSAAASNPTYMQLLEQAEQSAATAEASNATAAFAEIYAIFVLIISLLAFLVAALYLFRVLLKRFQAENATIRLSEPQYSGMSGLATDESFEQILIQKTSDGTFQKQRNPERANMVEIIHEKFGNTFFLSLAAAIGVYCSYILLAGPTAMQLIFISLFFIGFFFLFLFRLRR